jgi:hypothetical protein
MNRAIPETQCFQNRPLLPQLEGLCRKNEQAAPRDGLPAQV